MQILDLVQGTESWDKHRSSARNASAASCVLNFNPKTSRQEYLRICAGYSEKEISEWVQKNLFDKGHEVEDKARPVIADLIGEAVYPITGISDDDYLSASFDGITMDESTIWENKLDNKDLSAYIQINDDLPDSHWPQVEQQLMISKAERCLFTLFDKAGNMTVEHWYKSRPERQAQIMAAWQQFDIDLANYQHVEVKSAVTGAPVDSLPAIIYTMDKTDLSITSNFDVYKAKAEALTERAKTPLVTDQDFADRELLGKKFRESEKMLKVKAADVVGQVVDVAAFSKSLLDLAEVHRVFAVNCENAVKAEKENRRADIIKRGKDALTKHIDTLNTMLGKPYMPVVASDFPGAIKGKSNLLKIQDAADAELARCTIIADAFAKNIQINLNTLRDMASDYKTLFSDTATIVLKNNDDLVALIKMRISEHEKELADKKEREQAAIQNMRLQEASEGAKVANAPIVQPVQEVKPVISQPVKSTVLASTIIDPAYVEFAHWFKSLISNYGYDEEHVREAFVNGYNIGKRHGLDEK